MAVSKEDLLINIEVQTDKSQKNLQNLSGSSSDLIKSIQALEKAVIAMNTSFKSISSSIYALNNGIKNNSKDLEKASIDVLSFEDSISTAYYTIGVTEKAVDSLSDTTKSFIGLGLGGAAIAMGSGLKSFGNAAFFASEGGSKLINATKLIGSTFVKVAETGALLSPVIFATGSALDDSSNKFIKFGGEALKVFSLISAGFSAFVTIFTGALGSLFEGIGDKLLGLMAGLEEKASKLEKTMSLFSFTINGFVREFGSESIGTLKKWEGVLNEVVDTTIFSREQVAKSIKLFVAEGQALGLSSEENIKLLKRTADIASVTGRDLSEVTQLVLNGLTTNSAAVLSLGVDIRDLTLSHSEYLHATGLTIEQLNAEQLARVRLNALYEKTAPIVGAATVATQTIAGASAQYEKTLNDLSAKLGQHGVISRFVLKTQIDLANWFAKTPDFIVSIIGNLIDFSGVLFKVLGIVLKLTASVLVLNGVFALLNKTILATSGITLSLVGILSTVLTTVFPIVAVLGSLIAAFSTLSKESEAFADTLNIISDSFGLFSSSSKEASKETNVFEKALKGILGVIQLPLIGLTQLVNQLAAFIVMAKRFSSEVFGNTDDAEVYDLMLEDINGRINSLTVSSEKAIDSFNIFGSSTAYASSSLEQLGESISNNFSLVENFKERVVKGAKEINSNYDKNIERIKVFGNEYEAALNKVKIAEQDLKNVFSLKLSEKEASQKYAEAERALAQATFEIEKLRLDTIEKIGQQQRDLNLEILKSQGRNIEAIRLETDAKLAAFDKEVSSLRLLGELSEEQETAIKKTRKQIESISWARINDEIEKHNQKIDSLKSTTEKLVKLTNDSNKNEISAIKEKTAERLKELDALEKSLKKTNDLSKKAKELLAVARQSAVGVESKEINDLLLKTLEDIEKQNQQIAIQNETFGLNTQDRLRKELDLQFELIEAQREKLILEGKYSDAIGEALDAQKDLLKTRSSQQSTAAPLPIVEGAQSMAASVTGTASPLGAVSAVADVVQGLIDFIPQLLGKIEKIFTSLTELPTKILEGVQGVFDAALKFVADFIPNIIKAIPKLFDAAIKFVSNLPKVFSELAAKVPDLILGLLDKLPDLVKPLVAGVLRAIPSIMKTTAKFLIKESPRIAFELAKFLAIELPKALLEGIRAALTGESFELPIDTEKVADTFKKIGEALTGDTSRLFNVSDLTEAVVGPQEKLAALAENVKKAFKDGTDLLTKAWQWFEKNILMPLGKFVSDAFQWVVDNVLDPLAGVVETAFQWVIDNILTPLASIVEKAFQWVVDKVITPLVDFATTLGEKVKTAFNSLVSIGTDIGNAVKDAIYNGVDGLKTKFKELGAAMLDGFKEAWNAVADSVSSAFRNIGKSITSGLVDSLNSLGGKIADLIGKIPSIKVGGISLSDGGIIPGNAVAFGDSPRNDVVPAMLSPGEAVIPRSLMQDPAIAETVKSILQGRNVPRFADGLMPRLTAKSGDTSINLGGVVINTAQSVDADFVRAKLMPTIQKELRRASLDGQAVIYKAGIR